MEDDVAALTERELVVLGALVRVLVRLDGRSSSGEQQAVEAVGDQLALIKEGLMSAGPYRSAHNAAYLPPADIWRAIELSAEKLPTDELVKKAAKSIVRPAAREVILGALYHIAEADFVEAPEAEFLRWLEQLWDLRPS